MIHYYQKIFGYFNFENFYRKMVDEAKDGDIFVEIGCYRGRSTAFLATEILNSNKKITLNCVDTWLGSPEHLRGGLAYDMATDIPDGLFKLFLNNLYPFLGKEWFRIIREKSVDASKLFADESLDMVLIDAAHDYVSVTEDISAWYPKIKKNKILAGDDYGWESVKKAVDDFFGESIQTMDKDMNGYANTWIKQKI